MEVPSTEDLRADAKRTFRWGTVLPGIIWVVVCFQAIFRLEQPAITGTARILWALLPLPLMVWGFWSFGKAEARTSEFERAVNQEAAAFAYRLTIFWLFAVVLLNAAIGLPIEVWTPIPGLRETLGWREFLLLPPLFFSFIGFMVVRRRVFPRK